MAGQRRGFVAVSSPDGKGKKSLRPGLQVTIGTGQRCPYCHEHLAGDDALVACAECLTVFHDGCVAEGGGCTTLGCAHARPDLVQAAPVSSTGPAARRRPGALAVAALGVGLAGLGLGAWAALRPPAEIVDRWPAPPIAPARIVTFDATVAGDTLQVRADVEGPPPMHPRFNPDMLFAARVNGVAVVLQPTGQQTDRGALYRVVADLPRHQVLGDATGTLRVELTILSAGPAVSATQWVRLEPPPAPTIVYSPPPVVAVYSAGPTLRLSADAVQTRDSLVDVRGFVDADGPVTITVRSPSGDVTWEAQPGSFYGAVTVGPRAGTYELLVRVRDRHGLEATAVQRVEYLASR